MNLIKVSKVIKDEKKAEEFLRQRGILLSFNKCPYCGNHKLWRVRRNSLKCQKCSREWSIRKGSVLEKMKIPFSKFILALKLFELGVPALRACKELGVAYNTIHNIFMLIRKRIYKEVSEDNTGEGRGR